MRPCRKPKVSVIVLVTKSWLGVQSKLALDPQALQHRVETIAGSATQCLTKSLRYRTRAQSSIRVASQEALEMLQHLLRKYVLLLPHLNHLPNSYLSICSDLSAGTGEQA